MDRVASKVIVIIPAHDEERFIGSVVLKTRKFVERVIVVDDGSTDSTAEIAEAAGAIVVRHDTNSGKGIALNTGFAKAREFDPEVVITLDGDWQHRPEEVFQVAAPILRGEADIVVGSRYIEKSSSVPLQRAIGHWGVTSFTNITSGVSLTDSQSGYRAFSMEAIRRLNFDSAAFSVESEMQFLAKDYQLRIMEVPITIRYLDKPKRNVVRHGLIVLNGLLRLIAQHRPLLFFTLPGVAALLLGIGLGIWVVYTYNLYQSLAVGTALIAVLLSTLGTFSVFTGIMLYVIRLLTLEIRESRNPRVE